MGRCALLREERQLFRARSSCLFTIAVLLSASAKYTSIHCSSSFRVPGYSERMSELLWPNVTIRHRGHPAECRAASGKQSSSGQIGADESSSERKVGPKWVPAIMMYGNLRRPLLLGTVEHSFDGMRILLHEDSLR